MLNLNFSLFLDLTPPQAITDQANISQLSSEIGASLQGKPNKPNKPWWERPNSSEKKGNVEMDENLGSAVASDGDQLVGPSFSGDKILGDLLLDSQGCDPLIRDASILSQDSVSVILLADSGKLSPVTKDFTAWTEELPPGQIGIQQQGQGFVGLNSNLLTLATNSDMRL